MQRLSGKVCVINGAAGAIGEAVADRLSREDAIVVGVDRIEHTIGTFQVTADLSLEDEVADMYRQVRDEFGRIDVIHNNAGLVLNHEDVSALDTSLEVVQRVFQANFVTTLLCCKHGIPYLLENTPSGGSVINTGSFLAGMGSASGQMAYNAAKAAVVQLSKDLGTNLARQGVRVNALSLGPIQTPELTDLFETLGPEQTARRFSRMPLGRFGTLEELSLIHI